MCVYLAHKLTLRDQGSYPVHLVLSLEDPQPALSSGCASVSMGSPPTTPGEPTAPGEPTTPHLGQLSERARLDPGALNILRKQSHIELRI